MSESRYMNFTEDGYQAASGIFESDPGEGWYKVPLNIDEKVYKLVDGKVSPMTKKQLEDYIYKLNYESRMSIARLERDRRLSESDWTQLASSPLSDAKKAEWEIYRQALRDYLAVLSNDLEAEFPAEPQ
jgi:beta-glucosidase/6-phospho-beta-glucosidase/beta-galactosidase